MSIDVNQKIGVLCEAGFNGAAIFKQLKKDGVSGAPVYNVVSRIKKDQPLDSRVNSDRKPSVVSKELAQKVRCRLDRDPRRSVRKISRDLGIPRSSVERCVRVVLRGKAFKLGIVVALTDVTRKNRYKKCLLLFRLLAHGRHRKGLYVDETPAHVQELHCSQNSRTWTRDRRTLSRRKLWVPRLKHPEVLHVIVAASHDQKFSLIFLEKEGSLNAKWFEETVLPELGKEISLSMF